PVVVARMTLPTLGCPGPPGTTLALCQPTSPYAFHDSIGLEAQASRLMSPATPPSRRLTTCEHRRRGGSRTRGTHAPFSARHTDLTQRSSKSRRLPGWEDTFRSTLDESV